MDTCLYFYRQDQGTKLFYLDGSSRFVQRTPINILEEYCLMHGNSYQGAKDSFCKLLNVKQKPAILLDRYRDLIFIPTHSENSKDCVYINFKYILETLALDNGTTCIRFNNDMELVVNCCKRSIDNQKIRCNLFLFIVNFKYRLN